MPLARSFSNISRSFTAATRQLNSVATSILPLTGAVTQGAARTQNLASQSGNVNVNAREITNGFQASQTSSAPVNIAGQIGNLSGLRNVNVNQILSTATAFSNGPLGAVGNVVSNFTNTISGVTGAVQSLRSGTGLGDLTSLIGGFNINQFATNIINVVPRDFAELAFAIGGEFDAIRQRVAAIGDISNLEDFVDLTFSPQGSSPRIFGDSEADVAVDDAARNRNRNRIPNPLRNHNSFNYVVSLACMTVEENNHPETYRERVGFNQYIIRSSGGFYENRYQVLDEALGNTFDAFGDPVQDHAEYYIDDLEIDAVIAPNPNTGVAMGTTIRFTVTEPYSMGNFIEAIVGSVREKSLNAEDTNPSASVNGWPFCLQIDFVGYDEFGQRSQKQVTSPIFIPINIINMELNVTGQGSVYNVQAVAYSETALSDSINQIVTDVEASGTLIHKVLNGEANSVTFAINDRIDNLEANDVISAGDRFIIAFPRDIEDMTNAIREMTPTPDTIFTSIETPSGPQTVEVRNPSSQMFENLMAYARNLDKMNEIGLDFIVEDASEPGCQPMGELDQAFSLLPDTINRADPSMQVSTQTRTYSFSQGDRITNIIEDILLRSRYAAEKATEESAANGTRKWFKIVTQVYLDNTAQSIAEIGRPARIYVYSVIPYIVDEAKHLGPNEAPKNTQGLKNSAAKEYNYIYTGLNEDVLEFDLTFNNSFLQTALGNYGQGTGGIQPGDQKIFDSGADVNIGTGANRNSSGTNNPEPGAATGEVTGDGRNIGTRSGDVKLQVAKMFHDRLINQPTDLITAEMKILGDPFFLPQQTGNYIGGRTSGSPNVTADGTIAYMENEVFLVVNFNTPFDYQIGGATMEFPKIVPQFSGLFSCWAVTNNFSKGRFEQTLKIIRRTGQDNEPTVGNTGPTTVDDARTIVTPLRRPGQQTSGVIPG